MAIMILIMAICCCCLVKHVLLLVFGHGIVITVGYVEYAQITTYIYFKIIIIIGTTVFVLVRSLLVGNLLRGTLWSLIHGYIATYCRYGESRRNNNVSGMQRN